ncbi:MAG: UBA/THIF-type binding protein [Frankiales bacterium]|nr:UBA/THIF-type binding protein [Frankiales bacterium]
MRPVLNPAARRLWRDPQTLQLGRGSGRAVVLAGLDPSTRAVLPLLDGTRERAQVVAAASSNGCPADRVEALLDLLDSAGLLEDAGAELGPLAALPRAERERLGPDVASLALVRGDGGIPAARHRAEARVLVVGAGRVGAALAQLLVTAGVGTVDVLDEAVAGAQNAGVGGLGLQDVGRSRGEAVRERLRAAAPSVALGPLARPDLVVLAPPRPEQLEEARTLVEPGTPHLLAEVRDTVGVVGPLVLPGRSACLRCLDLTRTDLDPDWPSIAAQLASPSPARVACDSHLAVAVAAQAAGQVLALVDGTTDPASVGGTLERALPDWRWRRRTWPVHPECGCVLPVSA